MFFKVFYVNKYFKKDIKKCKWLAHFINIDFCTEKMKITTAYE